MQRLRSSPVTRPSGDRARRARPRPHLRAISAAGVAIARTSAEPPEPGGGVGGAFPPLPDPTSLLWTEADPPVLAARHGEAGRRSVIVPGDRADAQDASEAPRDPCMTPGGDRAELSDRRPLVLVVEDEESYCQALMSELGHEGFTVEVAGDGNGALRMFHRIHPDLVLLDVMLPDQSGVEVCKQMHAAFPVPIVMVSARDEEVDVVVGLEVGAADYVTKPFHLRELVARMRAVLRRGALTQVQHDEVPAGGPVHLDTARREVSVEGRPVDLSRKEFDLLALLMGRPGQVFTRERCIDRLWRDQELIDTRTLDTHVRRLRSKIELDPANPRHLVTVRGVGFRFDP